MNHNTVGVDAGGSLIKIVYEENGMLHFRKHQIVELNNVLSWLKVFSANKKIVLTGGKAGKIKAEFFPEAEIIDEFSAACEGAKYLMKKENIVLEEKFILVNIGTGTSWFAIESNKFERVLGSGIGGGTFMGLACILAKTVDFSEIVALSAKGNRGTVDLLVRDIYEPEEPPIPGDLTASNFAKTATAGESSSADQMAAVINMIAETITLLTVQTAALQKTTKAVFIGSTLAGNEPLSTSLDFYCRMSGLESIFLPEGEYSGALGAQMF